MRLRQALSPIDLVGLALVGAFGAWMTVSGSLSGRSAWPMLLTLLLCAVALVLGRLGTAFIGNASVPTAVVGLAVLVVYIDSPERIFSRFWAVFLGYRNANAAFFVQAAFAALMIAAEARSRKAAAIAVAAAALFAFVPVSSRSLGAFLSSTLLIPGAFVALAHRGRRPAFAVALLAVIVAVSSTVLLARGFSQGGDSWLVSRAGAVVGQGRAAAWSDAYEITRAYPWSGAGPGGFRVVSRTARLHPDLRWAHNEFLQQGAETGVVGLGLLLALLGWAFFRLARPITVRSALGALALASLLAHASADYLLHFPLIPVVTAALVGSSIEPSRPGGGESVEERARPRRPSLES